MSETFDSIEDQELYESAYDILPSGAPRRKTRVKIGDSLLSALETAAQSYLMIPQAQAELRELLDEELRTENPSKEWIKGREYQIWLVEQQLMRATELARERIDYISRIKTPGDVALEQELCAKDKHHWMRKYAWGFDPRPDSPLNIIPIAPFDVQTRFIDWLDRRVFVTRQSGVVPKSRDMGATEWALRWADYHWLYTKGFEVLLLSRTEDEVDSKNDVNTLFEKVRFQMRLLPEWMLPEGFDLDRGMPYMLIKNPENGSTFHGRAPTENVGRQLRVAAVINDEKAFAPNGGYKQHTSLSQTSKSLIDISSVGGRQNKFAELMTDGKTPQFMMDWREHPWKTEDWYNALSTGVFGAAMNAQQIAQEVDRDLDASQPGKVWKFREEYLFMTFAEVVSGFEKFGWKDKFIKGYDHDGKPLYRVPYDFRWSRYHDYGQTKGHEWGYLITGRPSEAMPFSDTIFVFLGLELTPTGLTEEQAVRQWTEYEEDLGLRNPDGTFVKKPYSSQNSHEQKGLRKVLRDEFGEEWSPWYAADGYTDGIPEVQTWFTIVDSNLPNPFRPEIYGRCRVVFVAPDNEYRVAFDERNGAWFVTNSKTERGYLTLRKQLSAYHYPESERGKDVKKMRPAKQFDDIVDCLREAAADEVKAEKRSRPQEVEHRTPDHLKEAEVAAHYGEDGFAELMVARIQEQRSIERQIDEENRVEQETLNRRFGGGGRIRLLGNRRRS